MAQALASYASPENAANLVLGALPGSGDVMAAQESVMLGRDMSDSIRQGDYGAAASSGIQALTAGAGALPFVPYLSTRMGKYLDPRSQDLVDRLTDEGIEIRSSDDLDHVFWDAAKNPQKYAGTEFEVGELDPDLIRQMQSVVPEAAAQEIGKAAPLLLARGDLPASLQATRPKHGERLWSSLQDLALRPEEVIPNINPENMHRPMLVTRQSGRPGRSDAVVLEADVSGGRIGIPTVMTGNYSRWMNRGEK